MEGRGIGNNLSGSRRFRKGAAEVQKVRLWSVGEGRERRKGRGGKNVQGNGQGVWKKEREKVRRD